MPTANTKPRDMLCVRVDPALARLVRLHRVNTGESTNTLLERLLRAEFQPKPRRPRPTKPAA
jgi:hypothetical protein